VGEYRIHETINCRSSMERVGEAPGERPDSVSLDSSAAFGEAPGECPDSVSLDSSAAFGEAPGECPDSVSPNSSISCIHHDYCQASTEWRNLAGASPRSPPPYCTPSGEFTCDDPGAPPRLPQPVYIFLIVGAVHAPPLQRHHLTCSRPRCRRSHRGRSHPPRRCGAALRRA
jgi:hypothetical protein